MGSKTIKGKSKEGVLSSVKPIKNGEAPGGLILGEISLLSSVVSSDLVELGSDSR